MISDDFDVTINALLRAGKTRTLVYHFSFGLKFSEHFYPALAVEDLRFTLFSSSYRTRPKWAR